MKTTLFRYRNHPGDLLRNTDTIKLPNPEEELEDFLIHFLSHFQSDSRVTYVDDLFKLLYDDFFNETEKLKFLKIIGNKTEKEIKEEINSVQNELKKEAYKNFYNLILNNKIELITNGKK